MYTPIVWTAIGVVSVAALSSELETPYIYMDGIAEQRMCSKKSLTTMWLRRVLINASIGDSCSDAGGSAAM